MIEKRRNKSSLKIDIIKAFGADFDLDTRDPIFFVSDNMRAIAYPVGQHIAIKDLYVRDDMRKNDIMFIYHDNDVKKITSMCVSKDNNLLLVSEKKEKSSCLAIYNLSKLNFNSLTIFKPKRKIVSTIYSEFLYASFSLDGNYIASIGVINHHDNTASSILQGIIWDVQIFQPFKDDNYKPRCIFDLNPGVTKISMENKILCTSGASHLSFWYIYENSVKEFKGGVKNLNIANNNFLDHDWVTGKIPTVVTITDKNDIYVLEGFLDKKDSKGKKKENDDEDTSMRVEKFIIRQHIVNCYNNFYINACLVRSFSKGIVVGSQQGNLLFLEKLSQGEQSYRPIRYTSRDKPAKVVGLSFNNGEEFMVAGFSSNEICTINANNIMENLSNENFELKFDLVCDGFHQGPIACMDLALQRPIIVTCSQVDKTIRVWNYLTGHCEYCKIILTEKDNEEREIDFLSVAIHPNGYYLAVSDTEMIRFFHLCYKELRFYNNDIINNDNPKSNCYLLKFSFGGHILAAVSHKALYIIRSYTRETIKAFDIPHSGQVKSIFFHEQDYYLYTVGTDGVIVEYNLFDFKM
jgi:WD40 repeat protein